MITYSHTQRSPLMPYLAAVVAGVIIGAAILADEPVLAIGVVLAAGALLVLLTLVFGRLTVEVADDHLRAAFGAGWPSTTVQFSDVESAHAVRNKWWMGFGIRWIPRGWLWNVWGLDAVELQLQSGRRLRIGTDEPDALLAAISGLVSLR